MHDASLPLRAASHLRRARAFAFRAILALTAIAAAIVVWELARFVTQTTLLPSAGSVWDAIGVYLGSADIRRDLPSSVFRFFIGYAIGAALGIVNGVLSGALPLVDRVFGVLLRIIRPLPPLALAPFIGILLGYSEVSRIVIVAITVFHPVWIATFQGTQATPKEYLSIARLANGRRYIDELWIHMMASLPHILSGMRVAIGSGFTALVAAETSGTSAGFLYRVYVDTVTFRLDMAVAVLVVLSIVCYAFDACFLHATRLCFPWILKDANGSRREK